MKPTTARLLLSSVFALLLAGCVSGQEVVDLVADDLATAAVAVEGLPTPALADEPAGAEPAPTAAVVSLDDAPDADARVEALLARMTLAEKIGQMTQVEKGSIAPGDIAALGIGSILSGGGGSPRPNTPEAWAAMVRDFQDEALSSRLGIPLIYGYDAIHGAANVDGATIFPQPIGLGATGDADLVRRTARATAVESAALGVRWNFAPVVAVPQDIRWGRTYESFSDDPALVAELGAAYVEGLQDAADGLGLAGPTAMLATAKHFIGDGATTWGSSTGSFNGKAYELDQGDMQLDEETLRTLLVPPYAAAIEAGAQSVMASYNSWQGEKVHGRADLLTDLLKDEMNFRGFIVSDWGGCDQINPDDYYDAIVRCINAGVDMNMVPYDYERFIETLTEAVEKGDVSQERIDEAVRRILRVKLAMGLFEQPTADPALLAAVGSADHRALAREAVQKSLVLLQNENVALPIDRTAATLVYVAGEAADDEGIQSGGWTIEWQGVTGQDIAGATTILEGIQSIAGDGVAVEYDRDGRFSGDARAAVGIAVVGERPYAEGSGDAADLGLTDADIELIGRVAERSEKTVVVLVSGRPLVITEALPLADAWVAAWLPGSEGQGVADVLFGDAPFSGTLPYAWPRSMEQVPLAALEADPEGPLFPRGFRLTTE
jgi:beta-glucosidase